MAKVKPCQKPARCQDGGDGRCDECGSNLEAIVAESASAPEHPLSDLWLGWGGIDPKLVEQVPCSD